MKMMMKMRNQYNAPKDAIESLKSRELKSMRKYVLRLLMLKEKYSKCMKYKNKTVKLQKMDNSPNGKYNNYYLEIKQPILKERKLNLQKKKRK